MVRLTKALWCTDVEAVVVPRDGCYRKVVFGGRCSEACWLLCSCCIFYDINTYNIIVLR